MSKHKLVPVEPTDDMVDAGRSQSSFPLGVYKAMIAAAPAVQGEPVVYLRKDQLRQVQRMGPMLGEIADSPRVDRVPVYTAPQPAPDAALLEAFDAGRRAAQADAAEEIGRLREDLGRCRHQASYSIGCEDALRIQLGKVRDIANKALAAHHKTEQEQEQ